MEELDIRGNRGNDRKRLRSTPYHNDHNIHTYIHTYMYSHTVPHKHYTLERTAPPPSHCVLSLTELPPQTCRQWRVDRPHTYTHYLCSHTTCVHTDTTLFAHFLITTLRLKANAAPPSSKWNLSEFSSPLFCFEFNFFAVSGPLGQHF